MMSSPSFEFTPEMIQAQRTLDSRIDHALSKGRELRAKVDEVSERLANEEPPTDAEVERFEAFITGYARTDAWQPVLDRIERGQLTWRAVVDNLVSGRVDPDIAAGMASLTQVPPATPEELVEAGVFPAPEAQAGSAEAADDPEERDQSGHADRFAAAQDEEEWLDENPPPWRG